MINSTKIAYKLLLLIIIALSVTPAFALGDDNRNLFLIGIMGLSPILIIAFNKYDKSDVSIIVFLLSIIVIPYLFQPQSIRWFTVLYSCMFGLSFMAYTRLLTKSKLLPYKYLKILKLLIIAYAITLLFQQMCVLLGLPVINVTKYNLETPWKLNSLSAEPSHSARILALLMYSYIVIKELILNRYYNFINDFKQDKWVWLAFFWTMITMESGTSYLFLPVILYKALNYKNVVSLVLIISIFFILIEIFNFNSLLRAFEVAKATISLDADKIINADHSASLRIVPFLILMSMLSLSTVDGWFGHGIDYVSTFMSEMILGVPEGYSGGGLLQLWIEYGFISFTLFVFFSLSTTYKKGEYLNLLFWFFLVFLYGVNNQIVWLCISILFTNNYFIKLSKSQKL